MQSFKLAGHSFSTFKQLFLNAESSDAEKNALVGLAYMYIQISIIQANPSYKPQNEFDMLNHIMRSLPSDHVVQKDISPFISTVKQQLDSKKSDNVSLQMMQKTQQQRLNTNTIMEDLKKNLDNGLKEDLSEKEHGEILELVKKMLDQIPTAQLTKGVATDHSKQPSSTAMQSLKQHDTTPAKTPDQAVSESSQTSTSTTSSSSKQPDLSASKSSKQIDSKTDLDTEEYLKVFFDQYSRQNISLANVKQIIEHLLANFNDQKKLVQLCLKAYQHIYDLAPRKGVRVNVLLKGMPALFEIFDKYLGFVGLNKLMLDSSFNLADKGAAENDAAYALYCALKAIIFDKGSCRSDQVNVQKYEDFLTWMAALGKKLVEPSQKINPKDLLYLPPAMQFKLHQLDEKASAAFLNFLAKYQEINKRADPFQQRPIALFLAKQDNKIIQLIDIMGIQGIAYMNKQLAGTVLTLERVMENLPLLDSALIVPMRAYHLRLQSEKQTVNYDNIFFNCLSAMHILTQFHDDSENTSLADFIMTMAKDKSPSKFLLAMGSVIIKKMLPDISVHITEQQIDEMFKRIPPERFVKLVLASQKMAQDEYREVFLQLLKLDLTGGNVDTFLHEVKQDNSIGRDLSQHNAKIRKKLEDHKISPSSALSYRKNYNFVVFPTKEDVNQVQNMQLVQWGYLQKLEEKTNENLLSGKVKGKQVDRMKAIQKCLSELKKSIKDEKKSEIIAEKLSNSVNERLIEKILTNYLAIKNDNTQAKQDSIPVKQATAPAKQDAASAKQDTSTKKDDVTKQDSSISFTFLEFAQHVKEQFDFIKANKVKDEKGAKDKRKREQYYFSVEQWPKEKAQTFFLGDDVGCCLATDGAEFQAMVQRRMDDAMLFHVAIDKMTGKPAALAWLYLAETQAGKIVLIANFFEVNARYGCNEMVRVPLLNGILKFTEQYLKDNPGIHGFYMNQLTYGWNIEDIRSYSVTSLPIADKVGGPYLLGDLRESLESSDEKQSGATCELTKNKYYLVSLDKNEFHQFDPTILEKEVNNSNACPLKEIIKNSILEMNQEGLTYEAVSQGIFQKHRIELEHFYSVPVIRSEAFLADMKQWHTEVSLSKIVIIKSLFDKLQPQASPTSTSHSAAKTLSQKGNNG